MSDSDRSKRAKRVPGGPPGTGEGGGTPPRAEGLRDARTLRCPNCGGTVPEEERRCGYCHAPVATLRCGHCFHMNVPDVVHCSGCGVALGLEPAGESDYLKCPACKLDFEVFKGEPGRLRDCGQCGGQFVEHALVRALLERREAYGLAAPRPVRKWNPLEDPVRYVPCPVCRALMNRKNFGGTSGVVVDVCPAHGLWFDAGELPRVLSFVESGGLAAARRREIEEFERRKSRSEGVRSPKMTILSATEREPVVALSEYAVSLLEIVANLMK